MARVTALSFVLLLALFEIGSCIRCRHCNSQSDPSCGDPFASKKPSLDCQSEESRNYIRQYLQGILPSAALDQLPTSSSVSRYCHKIVTATGTVIRSCLDSNSVNTNLTCEMLDKPMVTDDIRKIRYCSVCTKDDCNGASSMAASIPLALTLLVSYLYFK